MAENNQKIILIVEDDVALRNVLRDKLINEDFSVLVAIDGADGLKVALKNKPDLILLDIIMPGMDGVEMLRLLREDEWGEKVPVLLLTNDSNPEHMLETLKYNAVDYLTKSDWDLEGVIKKIQTVLKSP